MKAIYGKLSILCFAIPVILLYPAAMVGISAFYHPAVISQTISIVLSATILLSIPVGCLLGYLSWRKQEIPKCYRYIGFFLNFPWLVLLIYWIFLNVVDLFKN